MSKKVLGIIEGAVVIALGVLIAIFGGQRVMDIYFGVLFVIAGAILLAFGIATLIKTKLLSFGITFNHIIPFFSVIEFEKQTYKGDTMI